MIVYQTSPPVYWWACFDDGTRPALRASGFFNLHLYQSNPNPNQLHNQTRAQRQRVAPEKDKQGHRSMWRYLCRHITLWPCFDVVHRGNSNPNRHPDLHGKSARGDGSPLSRSSGADHPAPEARHQKRESPVRTLSFLVTRTGLEPMLPP